MPNRIETEARRNGMRITGQRKLIAKVLSESSDHPDIGEVHERVRARDKRISLATVYRMVRRLSDAGIITRHDFGDGRARVERAAKSHHDHLIDRSTGKIIEFRCPEIEHLQRKIAGELGYRLIGHKLELYAERLETMRNA